jgi:hypothetical protein
VYILYGAKRYFVYCNRFEKNNLDRGGRQAKIVNVRKHEEDAKKYAYKCRHSADSRRHFPPRCHLPEPDPPEFAGVGDEIESDNDGAVENKVVPGLVVVGYRLALAPSPTPSIGGETEADHVPSELVDTWTPPWSGPTPTLADSVCD